LKEREVIDWLLEEDQPSVRYRALRDLLDLPQDDSDVRDALSGIPRLGWAAEILKLQSPKGWWESGRNLYWPKYSATNWRALVLSDLGLTKEDPRVEKTAELILHKWLFRPWTKEESEVCIVGNTARMLTRFGYGDDPHVKRLFHSLTESQKEDGGWHCFGGDKGSLDCWEGLAAYATLSKSRRTRRIMRSIERGAEFYLERRLYDDGERRYLPWFRFHYPVHYYYDILVGLDVLTRLGYGDDERLRPALEILKEKRSVDGKWLLDKVHPDLGRGANYGPFKKPSKRFTLEQEGDPSKWITLTAMHVLKRIEGI
jgi:hypothetical protein